MKKQNFLVEESLNEFAKKRGRKPKSRIGGINEPDAWGSDEEFGEIELEDPEVIEDIEIEDNEEILQFQGKLKKVLKNELLSPEFNRRYVTFKIRPSNEIVDAVPMADLKDAFLFKINGKLRKVKIKDMLIAESLQESESYDRNIDLEMFKDRIIEAMENHLNGFDEYEEYELRDLLNKIDGQVMIMQRRNIDPIIAAQDILERYWVL